MGGGRSDKVGEEGVPGGRGEVGVALVGVAYGAGQLVGGELAVDEVADGAQAQRPLDGVAFAAVGEHQDGGEADQVGQGGEAVDAGHADVEEDHVGAVVAGGGEGAVAVAGLGDDADARARGEQGAESGADHLVVVGDDDAQGAAGGRGLVRAERGRARVRAGAGGARFGRGGSAVWLGRGCVRHGGLLSGRGRWYAVLVRAARVAGPALRVSSVRGPRGWVLAG
ncbi:hypothetical protein SFR_4814 [Streptomyces sp. FR-008]|nr:hypothetical protein SFR_4814 [Streptomyces sp. FR-008]